MTLNHNAAGKLLPKKRSKDNERDEPLPQIRRHASLINIAAAFAAAVLLALALIPRTPVLEHGDVAPHDITAPYPVTVEYFDDLRGPLTITVRKGELVVEAGHRVSEQAERILALIGHRERQRGRLHVFAGIIALVFVFFYLFYRDIKRYRPSLIAEPKKIILLTALLAGSVCLAQVSKFIFTLLANRIGLDEATVGYALPVASGAMFVSLLLDFHLALGFSFVIGLLMGISFQGDPFMPVYYFLTSIVSALMVIRCKKRTAVLKAGAGTALVAFVVIAGIDLYRGELSSRLMLDLAAGSLGAILITMIVSAILPFLETIFDIATDIKLLELLDPNHALLKELVYKSPGTYHHSIIIGNLAEAAAETIGENPILARVGAYYHDIGKIHKPEYFIENQRPAENKHDRLTPSMSSLIITSHVKEGVDVARSQRLPSAVVDIIQQHHGTSLITFFYRKAKELQPYSVVSEADYRYPGPRPRTKVAAIVMLADSVEAASRTLDNPSPHRIQALTTSVITRIFLDDQLSMCDLTLKDLRDISQSFNMVLSGIFHHRINYPGIEYPGEKKRGDHQNKKHTEEKKSVICKDEIPARDPLEQLRTS